MAKKKFFKTWTFWILSVFVISSLLFGVFGGFQQTSLNTDSSGGVSVLLPGGGVAVSVDDYNSRVLSEGFVQQTGLGSARVGESVIIFKVDEPGFFGKLFGLFSPVQQSVAWSDLSEDDKQAVSSGSLVIDESYASSRGYDWLDENDPVEMRSYMDSNPDVLAVIGDKDDANRVPITYRDKSSGEILSVTTIAYRTQLDFVPEELGGNDWTLKETGVYNPTVGLSTVMTDRDVSSQTYTKSGSLVYDENLLVDINNWCDINPEKCVEVVDQASADVNGGLVDEKFDGDANGVADVNEERGFFGTYGVLLGIVGFGVVLAVLILFSKKRRRR